MKELTAVRNLVGTWLLKPEVSTQASRVKGPYSELTAWNTGRSSIQSSWLRLGTGAVTRLRRPAAARAGFRLWALILISISARDSEGGGMDGGMSRGGGEGGGEGAEGVRGLTGVMIAAHLRSRGDGHGLVRGLPVMLSFFARWCRPRACP